MTSDTEYLNILDAYNFNDQGYTTVGDQYQMSYAFLVSADLPSISYYTGTVWTTGFSEATTSVKAAFNSILAPAGTVAYTAYYSDVSNIEFSSTADTGSSVQIQIGVTSDADPTHQIVNTSARAATLTDSSNPGQYGDIWLNGGQPVTVTGNENVSGSTFGALTDSIIVNGETVYVGGLLSSALLTNVNTAGSAASTPFSASLDGSGHLVITTTSGNLVIAAGAGTGLADAGLYPDAGTHSPGVNWYTDTVAPGSEAFLAILHELGHSLGLDHENDSGYENLQFSVMATPTGSTTSVLMTGEASALPYGLQLEDIQAIQSIYGANYSTRSGNDAYGFGHGFGAPGSTTSSEFTYSIWDGGGINVIDASSYDGAGIINLNEGSFSSIGQGDSGVGTASNNVSIAYGAIIQNAIGTDGSDSCSGGACCNTGRTCGDLRCLYSLPSLQSGLLCRLRGPPYQNSAPE